MLYLNQFAVPAVLFQPQACCCVPRVMLWALKLTGEEAEDGASKGANSVGPTGPASGSIASKNWLDLQEVV